MTKKINKPEIAVLNDVFVTVASQILNSLLSRPFTSSNVDVVSEKSIDMRGFKVKIEIERSPCVCSFCR